MKQQFSLIISIGVLSIFGTLSSFSYAQSSDVIFKCVDAQGNISYVNVNSAKSSGCSKTDLATIDKLSTVSSERNRKARISSAENHSSSGSSGMVVKDEDQQIRETKRIVVLKRELADEQEQLSTVNSMLSNVGTKDPAQAGQLKEMQLTHQKNIESLQKELGMRSQPSSITPNPLTVVNTTVNTTANNTTMSNLNSVSEDSEQREAIKHILKKKKIIPSSNSNNSSSNIVSTDIKKTTGENKEVNTTINNNTNSTLSMDNSNPIEKIKSSLNLNKLPIVKKFVPTETTVTQNTSVKVNTNLDPAKFLLNK